MNYDPTPEEIARVAVNVPKKLRAFLVKQTPAGLLFHAACDIKAGTLTQRHFNEMLEKAESAFRRPSEA